jgi:hypothetical protein
LELLQQTIQLLADGVWWVCGCVGGHDDTTGRAKAKRERKNRTNPLTWTFYPTVIIKRMLPLTQKCLKFKVTKILRELVETERIFLLAFWSQRHQEPILDP